VPAYLAARTPWEQSGKTGTAEDWEYLMECLPRWTSYRVEPYGLDLSSELAALARRRLPGWADRIFVGNALTWDPPRRFDVVRTGLEYVPAHRRRDLVERLLGFSGRLVIGVFNEHESERTTEEFLHSQGYAIGGRSTRPHPRKGGMEYRVLWIDA
jgi:hypothetical protein